MWFLENAWLVPLIPAVSFAIILLFGKRMPRHGAEVGIAAVGASFVLSVGAAIQWINRVRDAEGTHGVSGALGALGRSVGHMTAEDGHGARSSNRSRAAPRGSRTAASASAPGSRSTASP